MHRHPLPTAEHTFERSLTGADGSTLQWSIRAANPRHGGAHLDYAEARDGTVTITSITVHPNLARAGIQRMLVDALAEHHRSHLRWRLAPALARGATGPAAPFWARVAADHILALADQDGVELDLTG
ncbi:hypothetical protein CHO01_16980 [Cellulomonas hominis]|uniref:Uncharacterized protein n=1 Tax=Cellulomonas hominis TaxID=156981 RepID=A0A511FBH9_9CELL|nr:hypothetical protein CHO01_16980 [Cellulomonas hominis]